MHKLIIVISFFTLGLLGCSNMSDTQQRTLSGAGIGATAGAVGAAVFHANPVWGAVGGAAVGAASGYVYDEYEKENTQCKSEYVYYLWDRWSIAAMFAHRALVAHINGDTHGK
jgi:hypothetical protein